VSNAAAYLFAEFDRLHILESELFTNNEKFEKRQKPAPDLQVQTAFEAELKRSEQISDRILARSPGITPHFSPRSWRRIARDYMAMVEKRNWPLWHHQDGTSACRKTDLADPSYYDAYLAVASKTTCSASTLRPSAGCFAWWRSDR